MYVCSYTYNTCKNKISNIRIFTHVMTSEQWFLCSSSSSHPLPYPTHHHLCFPIARSLLWEICVDLWSRHKEPSLLSHRQSFAVSVIIKLNRAIKNIKATHLHRLIGWSSALPEETRSVRIEGGTEAGDWKVRNKERRKRIRSHGGMSWFTEERG